MTIKLASLKADLAREEAGDWVEYSEWPGVAFNVSSLHKPAYVTARDLLVQRTAKSKAPADLAKVAAEFGRLYAEHILHNWRGLDEEYTLEKAKTCLTDPAYRDLVAAVEWCAAKIGEVVPEVAS